VHLGVLSEYSIVEISEQDFYLVTSQRVMAFRGPALRHKSRFENGIHLLSSLSYQVFGEATLQMTIGKAERGVFIAEPDQRGAFVTHLSGPTEFELS
jgi:hypothetical protein